MLPSVTEEVEGAVVVLPSAEPDNVEAMAALLEPHVREEASSP
jgi:hypothetical protein